MERVTHFHGLFIDVTGQRFGRLVALEPMFVQGDKRKRYYWRCKCDCGNECTVNADSLRGGHTKSCGCIINKHGQTNTRLHSIWTHMKQRCYNPKNKYYADYGGRGIGVCDEWRSRDTGFVTFRDWAVRNGYRDDLTIERVDVNLGYSPENCTWIPMKEQVWNRRVTLRFEVNGKSMTIRDLSEMSGISPKCLRNRITRYGMTAEEAINHKKHAKIVQETKLC